MCACLVLGLMAKISPFLLGARRLSDETIIRGGLTEVSSARSSGPGIPDIFIPEGNGLALEVLEHASKAKTRGKTLKYFMYFPCNIIFLSLSFYSMGKMIFWQGNSDLFVFEEKVALVYCANQPCSFCFEYFYDKAIWNFLEFREIK